MIYNSKKHWWRLVLGFGLIAFFSISPFIIGIIGAYVTELQTGEVCHEANCFWGAFPWYTFFTIPVALVIGFIFSIISIIDIVKVWSK